MIRLSEVTRRYGGLVAVDDVSFEIGRGEIVGLLGHNGAGKTTIMKMMTGYLEPDAGQIEIAGIDVSADRVAAKAHIGYLPENCPLYTEMTVTGYLEYCAALHGLDGQRRTQAIRSAIADTELDAKALDKIDTLSRGYRQRVGVAQAILHRPDILILDEPTNGLDPSQIQHMRALIRRLAQNSTVVLSTHIMQEVQAVCDRVIVIHEGRIALDSDLAELQSTHRLFVRLDADAASARTLLSQVDSVDSVEEFDGVGAGLRFALGLDGGDPDAVAAMVADTVHTQGFKLFALYPESRTLESVFAEISGLAKITTGAANGAGNDIAQKVAEAAHA